MRRIQMSSCQNNKKNKIAVGHMTKGFEGRIILEDVSFHVGEGEFISIVGPSGSGKSTILNILAGIINEDAGEVEINGLVSYMYQKDMLVPWKKVIDNIGLPFIFQGKKKKQARELVRPYLEDFGLKECAEQYPSKLSGGMRQRANFLKTFLTSKDIMLLDEPFGALDAITKRNMQEWLLQIQRKYHSTVLLITHDIEEALYLSDRVYVLGNKPATIKGEVDSTHVGQVDEDFITSRELLQARKEVITLLS